MPAGVHAYYALQELQKLEAEGMLAIRPEVTSG
jgi:hypothetical protein